MYESNLESLKVNPQIIGIFEIFGMIKPTIHVINDLKV